MALITRTMLLAGGILSFYALCVSTQTPETSFLVMFPAHITSGSEAKVCATLLSPNETLLMSVYLSDGEEKKLLHQETSDKEFHSCFTIQTPSVNKDSVQSMTVEVKGQTSLWTQQRLVKVRRKPAPVTFIQTDKPIYSPSQTVHFRLVTMDTNFIPLSETYNLVSLVDSRQNTIGQWHNLTSETKIVQLSYGLNPEAPEGTYTLNVAAQHGQKSHTFEVKQYVLPKFAAVVNTPEKISIGAEELKLEVCGKYTFGQPVAGTASMSLCRKVRRHFRKPSKTTLKPPCSAVSLEMDATGCASHVFSMASLFQTNRLFQHALTFKATVAEEGTGITMDDSKDIRLEYKLAKLTFIDTPNIIEEGAVLNGKIKFTRYDGALIPLQTIYLFKGPQWRAERIQTLTTDSDGVAQFSLNTATISGDFELIASALDNVRQHISSTTPHYGSASLSISKLRPPSADKPTSSSLAISPVSGTLPCDTETPIPVTYTFAGETFNSHSLDIMFMVFAKGEIVQHGVMQVPVTSGQQVIKGKESFKLSVQPEMAPSVHVMVYCILPSKTILAESREFSTERCFRNKVSVQFSPPTAVPGQRGSLQLSAQPGSLCGLSTVDQSVFILAPGKQLDAQKVFALLPTLNSQIDDTVEDLKCEWEEVAYPHDGPPAVLKRLGLKAVTNMVLQGPWCEPIMFDDFVDYAEAPDERGRGGPIAPEHDVEDANEAASVTVRTVFPETWLWTLEEVGESGNTQISVTIPDTITSWETEAFCLHPQGFGLAPPVQLTVFQPFFLELSLPYSIIRGETFQLKATVFNYLPKCIMVTVTPFPSSDFSLSPSADGQYSSCLCANGRKTFSWTLVPSTLGLMNITVAAEATSSQTLCGNELVTVPERGRIDIVTRPLLVKAEGTEKMESFNWLLCPKGGALSEEVELKLPEDVIKGSAHASISVLGDILGRALKNMEGLLKMPYGCGEQNMAILSPNIYILQYLHNTGQLTTDIREKATNFLKSGYQRQLNYRHSDGAYSTFGKGDGNTWLTAFVMRSFGKAKSFTYIDPEVLKSAETWLRNKLRPSGVFHMQGNLFNNRMKGGVNSDITITAYITASMLELDMPVPETTMSFLKASVSDLSNMYSTALLAYTFSLAGEEEIRDQLLKHLDTIATSSGGTALHWSPSSSELPDSLAVETSSYVLLAVLTKPTLTTADLGDASRIVSWLVKQQNPYGGFSSTQDTVVALQALALYATAVFSPQDSSTVTVEAPGGAKQQFEVNQLNALLYQEGALLELPGKYSIEAKGSACTSIGVALFYNVPTPSDKTTLAVTAQAKPRTEGECNKATAQILNVEITVTYHGTQESTNMAMVDVTMLSGFIPDPGSLELLKGIELVDRVEKKDDHVLIYLSQVQKGSPAVYKLAVQQDVPVSNLQPALVKVYDYYQPSDQSEAEYSYPCA
ncbi:alpha-2-macroglobulin-like protein 1 [Engraulis encrasicolus]|uniref:alpha-2-macroglobulin-like protein 1 n=1 Tax=Engraulis encrasicolus TaxID=184585 RepID=UPI002FD500A1